MEVSPERPPLEKEKKIGSGPIEKAFWPWEIPSYTPFYTQKELLIFIKLTEFPVLKNLILISRGSWKCKPIPLDLRFSFWAFFPRISKKSKDLKIQEVQKSDIYLEIRESRNPEIEESRNSESKSLHIEKIHTLSILQFLNLKILSHP